MDTLSLRLALAGSLATAGGCVFRYDVDDLDPEAESGAPGALHIDGVTPAVVYEGQGDASGTSGIGLVRAVPVVLRGSSFTDDMIVEVEGDSFSPGEVPFTASADGHWLAFELRVPVDEERSEGEARLTVRVAREGKEDEVELVHALLPELDLPDGGTVATNEESGVSIYSRISLRGAVTAAGPRPVRLFGYGGISLDGALSADGTGRTSGAGGCDGAEIGQDADCGRGSGAHGADAVSGGGLGPGGGGGGAFGADAEGGAGDRGGGPGEPTSARVLVPMPPASQLPAGGGGGGRAAGLGGGPGGGSGGILELTTPGVFEFKGVISANGASAGPCVGGGGGGGGGSGGAILIRGGAGILASGTPTLRARGGEGGETGCTVEGGGGGGGLIRVDRPDALAIDANPEMIGGPSFVLDGQVLTSLPKLSVTIRGAPGIYNVVIAGFDREVGAPASRTETISTDTSTSVSLWAGHNELCVQAATLSLERTYPESQNCVTVAYIP